MEDSTSRVWHAGRGAGGKRKGGDQVVDEEGEDGHIGSQGPGPKRDKKTKKKKKRREKREL